MRLKAYVKNHPKYKKVILHQTGKGAYLFKLFDETDGSGGYDSWHESIESAKYQALNDYGIEENDWVEIPDPLPGAQQDWETPTVAIRDKDGTVSFLAYEEAQQKDLIPKETPIIMPNDKVLVQEIRGLLRNGKPIQAMQLYMKRTGANLLDTKRTVELIGSTDDE
ncbi:MAG: hypothetical protein ABI690_14660 [Chloroflexota bacterium]